MTVRVKSNWKPSNTYYLEGGRKSTAQHISRVGISKRDAWQMEWKHIIQAHKQKKPITSFFQQWVRKTAVAPDWTVKIWSQTAISWKS